MKASLQDLKQAIELVVRAEFPTVDVVSVNLREDVDHDDVPILRVEVVVAGNGRNLDSSRVLGLVRHVRSALDKIGEMRFPVFNFMTPHEVEDMGPAAA